MEFQVVTAKRLPRTFAGRSLIVLYFRKNMEAVTTGIDDYKTDTGMMKLSSATLTALDLLRYPQATGGINNIATVLAGFRHRIDPLQLASLSMQVERPVVQRLGYLLEHLHHDTLAEPMLEALHGRGPLPWVELNRQEIRDPEFAPEPRQRDLRWRVIVRRVPERRMIPVQNIVAWGNVVPWTDLWQVEQDLIIDRMFTVLIDLPPGESWRNTPGLKVNSGDSW